MRKLRKLLAMILSTVLLFGAVGCGGSQKDDSKGATSQPAFWTSAENIRIGGFVAPVPANYYGDNESYITVERYQELKNAGFDFIVGHAETGFKSADVLQALECAKEAGIQYVVNADILVFANSTPERIQEAIGSTLEQEGCFGAFAVDEPQASRYATIAKLWEKYRLATDKKLLINLLPYIVEEDFPMYNATTYEELYSAPSYEAYIEYYCQQVKNDFISVDIYPFYEDTSGVLPVYTLYEPWLRNLEIVENLAIKYGREHWQCVQGQKVHGFSKEPDYNDIRMQVYTSMAYGAQTFQYYCYFTPREVERPCLIDKNGNRTAIYDAAKRVNDEIHAFGDVFVDYVSGWKGVMPIGQCAAFDMLETPLQSYKGIESVKAADNALLGVFNDRDGNDAYMLTNFTVPGYGLDNSVSLKLKDTSSAVCYIGGQKQVIALEDGELKLTLGPGEGIFIIPQK